jgi:hypothetical protein
VVIEIAVAIGIDTTWHWAEAQLERAALLPSHPLSKALH